ncbi:MAG: class I SAM-dependent methyltransferase [Fibrobacterota bacterium]
MIEKFDAPLTVCRLCTSANIAPFTEDFNRIAIWKCCACGVRFMNPQYSAAYLEEFYAHYTTDRSEWDEPYRYTFGLYLARFEKLITGKGRFLDIGCGNGNFIVEAAKRGWEPSGYEIDSALAKKVSERTGLPVFSGDFPALTLPVGSFDVVSMHHVIEHLKNPPPYLKKAHALLKPGGILLLALPNIRSRSAVVKRLLEHVGLKRKRCGACYDTGHHLFYFSPAVLRGFLGANGFFVLHMQSGHAARPGQSRLTRWWARTVTDRFLWKSTFLVFARKQGSF